MITVVAKTAMGIRLVGFLTSSPRVVADSKPTNAKIVYTTAISSPDDEGACDGLKGCSELPADPPCATMTRARTRKTTVSKLKPTSTVASDGRTPITTSAVLRARSAIENTCQ